MSGATTVARDGRIRVLELRSVFGTGGGPEKTILLGTALTDTTRFDVTVCYIRDERDGVFAIDEWSRSLGIPYIEVTEAHSLDPAVVPKLRAIVRERGIDIVHAHEYKTDFLALLVAKLEGIIPLSTAHGWTGHSAKERYGYYPADRWLLARFPRVIAVSEEIRQRLIRAGAKPERVTTVLNSIDPGKFRRDPAREPVARAGLGLPADAVVLGAVGRAEPQKRFDLLVDAFAELAAARPRLHLVIAGDGSCLPALRDQVAALGPAGARVHLLGHRTDVPDLHHAFDVFVQSSDYEGTPNAVLEAMALGTPLVATRAGGTEEIAFDGVHGRLVACGDRAALVGAMAELCDDPARARSLAAAARHRVETDLAFANRVARVERIYEELMAARGRRRR
jgi:glycosyltransferase involved in cell wall biosynthesis